MACVGHKVSDAVKAILDALCAAVTEAMEKDCADFCGSITAHVFRGKPVTTEIRKTKKVK